MMEAPIRLFEHSKTGRRLPRMAAYALTLQTSLSSMINPIRITARSERRWASISRALIKETAHD